LNRRQNLILQRILNEIKKKKRDLVLA
jgi:hypothetical protein